jgi:hypothetical protein
VTASREGGTERDASIPEPVTRGDASAQPSAASGAPSAAAQPPPSAAATVLRAVVRPIGLAVTALVIVVGLAFGIPWLISLVW